MAIAYTIRPGCGGPLDVYRQVCTWADETGIEASVRKVVRRAAKGPPTAYVHQQGWVLTALHNAFFQLLHASCPEDGVVDTVMRGGDTDTNAAICGALLGAVYGRDPLPRQWVNTLLNCRPAADRPGVHHPRPEHYWPVDALELAERLLTMGR